MTNRLWKAHWDSGHCHVWHHIQGCGHRAQSSSSPARFTAVIFWKSLPLLLETEPHPENNKFAFSLQKSLPNLESRWRVCFCAKMLLYFLCLAIGATTLQRQPPLPAFIPFLHITSHSNCRGALRCPMTALWGVLLPFALLHSFASNNPHMHSSRAQIKSYLQKDVWASTAVILPRPLNCERDSCLVPFYLCVSPGAHRFAAFPNSSLVRLAVAMRLHPR